MSPLTLQMRGRTFSDLSTEEAASVLEGVGLLQILRGGVSAIPVLAVYAILRLAGTAESWSGVVDVCVLALVTVLPIYGLLLSILLVPLGRSQDPGATVASTHPRVIRCLRLTPGVAGVLAVCLGYILH